MTREEFLTIYRSIVPAYGYRENKGVGIFTIPAFSAYPGIDHGFSARTGGVSTGCFSSLNLSFTRPEQRENVMENYRIFCDAAGIPLDSMVMDTYEHGTTVLCVNRFDCRRGYDRPSLPYCDGLVTDDPEVTLITGHADCMAFYFYDPLKRGVGLCHAGWRGALDRIGAEVIRTMETAIGSDPKDIVCGVGPSICPKCFEVGDDVAESFVIAFPQCDLLGENAKGKATVDLWQVATAQFLECGILPEHIHLMGVCTFEDERLYSHRRDKGKTGGMAAFLRLLPENGNCQDG